MDSSTNVSLLGNLPPLAITLITLYLFIALAHKIVSFMIPFNVSSMRVDQDCRFVKRFSVFFKFFLKIFDKL